MKRFSFSFLFIFLAISLTLLFIGFPLIYIFFKAFEKGVGVYLNNLLDPLMLHAMGLSILTVLIAIPINIFFGVSAAWLITKYDFPGKQILITFIELPLSISPIIAGICYLLLYGQQGLLGPFLMNYDIKVVFALPGIILVTLFVTCPYVARELIPLMQEQGREEEQVALTLGASGFEIFRRITLPNIKWALLYGVLLCSARAIGEFGSIAVVSGNIRGQTTTLPLYVELLFNDFNITGAFTAASTLTFLSVITLILKFTLDHITRKDP